MEAEKKKSISGLNGGLISFLRLKWVAWPAFMMLKLRFFFILIFAFYTVRAQPAVQDSIIPNDSIAQTDFVKQTIHVVPGKVYICWVIKGNNDVGDCLFSIERSIDSSKLELAGFEEGYGCTPVDVMYCWTDLLSASGIIRYIIYEFNTEGKLIAQSELMSVQIPPLNAFNLDPGNKAVARQLGQ